MFTDYYEILEIPFNLSGQSEDKIKKAYRKQASIWHPDVNKSPNATEKMKLINEAYIILKDKEAREKYNKEYENYFKKKESRTEMNSYAGNYAFEDEILEKWMWNAKMKSQNIVKESLLDILGATSSGFSNMRNEFVALSKFQLYLSLIVGVLITLYYIFK